MCCPSVTLFCRLSSIKVLHLNGNDPKLYHQRLTTAQLFAICESLVGSELTFIDLSFNDATPANQHGNPDAATFGDEAAATVARLMKQCASIASVILKGNAIGPAGTDEIAQALMGDSDHDAVLLKVLVLADNPIGDDVCAQCCRYITSATKCLGVV